MSMDEDGLDRRLAALKRELATFNPPPAVDRSITAAIAGMERGASRRARWFTWVGRERGLAWPLAIAAALGLPVSPVRTAEPVASELLVRADGTVLAVRFLE